MVLTETLKGRGIFASLFNDSTPSTDPARYSDPIVLADVDAVSISVTADVTAAPGAKSFESGFAHLTEQDITFNAKTIGVAGTYIKISYTGGGSAGFEDVTRTGTGTSPDPYIIDVSIESGASTATQVKAALDAHTDFTDLATATISGTAGDAQIAFVATALAGGSAAVINLTTGLITVNTHGFSTGMTGKLTTEQSLPGNFLTNTTYYVYKYDANTFGLASSYANAVAGTCIVPNTRGLGTHTFTPTAFDASWTVEATNRLDLTGWFVITNTAVTQDGTGNFDYPAGSSAPAILPYYAMRLKTCVNGGTMGIIADFAGKCAQKYPFFSINP